jgi:hypothetical protein
MKNQLRAMLAISLSATLLGTQVSSVAFAQDAPPPPVVVVPPIWTPGMTDSSGQLVPPPLFNQDGSPFQNREQYTAEIPQRSTSWFPGMRDASGTEIPPPLYNVDGTPYVEGVSPRPQIPILSGGDVATGSQTIETVLAQTIDWYPGMSDRSGNEIPAPLFNQDGSAYIEGVSPRPKIPVYAEVAEPKMPIALAPISDQVLVKKVNTEIRSTDVTLRKASDAYVLAFDENISAVDSSLYLSAVNKRNKKATKIPISINSLGQAVAVTKVDLSKFNVFIKRGKSTLNKVKIGEPGL